MEEGIKETTEEVVEKTNHVVTYLTNHIPDFLNFGIKVVLAILVFIIGRWLIGLIVKIVNRSLMKAKVDKGVIQFARSFVQYGLYILLVILIITQFGIDTTSIAAVIASLGVGIGLALQGSLSNFAGGVLILLLRPFVVGDYIKEDTNKNEGTVKEIQLFYTKLTTIDNRTVLIPNGMLTNNSLTNASAMNERQLDIRIDISYESDVRLAKSILENLLDQKKTILSDEERRVFVDDLGDSSVVLGIRAWTKNEDYLTTKWELLEEIKHSFDEKQILIPYPQLEIHMDSSGKTK
ncbi:small conductance mechanosensitive channel [Aequitasia blattaphilus]|uniref:Mechanosensitive ion channel n=1 Tax=Aequitasia blattaphilus TaxID=2949332 RepID=A0ABT1E704_9FIRM|nr:mechanosensitive ion channel domain-containing protein [Aequitasia blattaphilus]MCP1101611.1 mechanosensitive ion channel [Aequitasia blattaphilus]MCR8614251.1 mechanosensitive ion channel [Aequitasia blattaphilus]